MLIHMDDSVRAIELAIAMRKNVVLDGRPGHAKSMIADMARDQWEREGASVYMMSCHVDMGVADLFGGLDPEAFKNFVFDRYLVEQSWFCKADVLVAEELFDASERVTAALKDALMRGEYVHGNERVKMRTRTVIALTNHDPDEVAEQSASSAALVERFPIRLRVEWPTYGPDDFEAMFASVKSGKALEFRPWKKLANGPLPDLSDRDTNQIAAFMATAVSLGLLVNPRLAMFARDIMRAGKKLDGVADIKDLRFLTGIGSHYAAIEERYKRTLAFREQEKKLDDFSNRFTELMGESTKVVLDESLCLKYARELHSARAKINAETWLDEIVDRARRIADSISQLEREFTKRVGL